MGKKGRLKIGREVVLEGGIEEVKFFKHVP